MIKHYLNGVYIYFLLKTDVLQQSVIQHTRQYTIRHTAHMLMYFFQ